MTVYKSEHFVLHILDIRPIPSTYVYTTVCMIISDITNEYALPFPLVHTTMYV